MSDGLPLSLARLRASDNLASAQQTAARRMEWLMELGRIDVALQLCRRDGKTAQARELFQRLQQLEQRLGFS